MPAKTEKQRKFFGAVMSAKKGSGKMSKKAKDVAKQIPIEKIKHFLKKESIKNPSFKSSVSIYCFF